MTDQEIAGLFAETALEKEYRTRMDVSKVTPDKHARELIERESNLQSHQLRGSQAELFAEYRRAGKNLASLLQSRCPNNEFTEKAIESVHSAVKMGHFAVLNAQNDYTPDV